MLKINPLHSGANTIKVIRRKSRTYGRSFGEHLITDGKPKKVVEDEEQKMYRAKFIEMMKKEKDRWGAQKQSSKNGVHNSILLSKGTVTLCNRWGQIEKMIQFFSNIQKHGLVKRFAKEVQHLRGYYITVTHENKNKHVAA